MTDARLFFLTWLLALLVAAVVLILTRAVLVVTPALLAPAVDWLGWLLAGGAMLGTFHCCLPDGE